MYVLEGSSLTFLALPDPVTAKWPAKKPIWTIPANTSTTISTGTTETGPTTTIKFNEVSNDINDLKMITVTPGNDATDKAVSINVVVTGLTLKQVSFSGTGYHTVKNDLDGSDFNAPQWQDNSTPSNGSADDAGDRNYPLCYTRNTTASVSVVLVPVPTLPNGASLITNGDVKIKANAAGTAQYSVPATVATVDSTGVSAGTTASGAIPLSAAFPNTVFCYIPPILFQWFYSSDEGVTWTSAGVSDHKVYVTLGDPITTNLYQTVLETGCKSAQGEFDPNTNSFRYLVSVSRFNCKAGG